MTSDTTPLNQYLGQTVPRMFSPGFVVLSYVVSYIGAWTTLELINRRTSNRGLYNWTLLIGASISMGGIAIWCMHYIGNRAIILGGGANVLQIAYNPGYTALSFFVPILVLLAAFSSVGSNERISVMRIVLGGTLAGLGICGMHYLGQAGILNYVCIYQIGNIVGAAAIAIVASSLALFVFFALRSAWSNYWWKRALTSLILSGGVSGMHWTASVGTAYRLKQKVPGSPANLSNNSTVIVVIVLSISACILLLALSVVAQRRRSRSANRAQQVILGAAIFDKEGRLMVTPTGLLPNTKITDIYIERSFDDVFGISHPVFLWIFRLSRNWSSISTLLPAMKSHLHHVMVTNGARPGTGSAELELTDDAGEPIEDYSIIFRELFCLAAAALTDQLNWPIGRAGILFDQIINTGRGGRGRGRKWKPTSLHSPDSERGAIDVPLLGRGQLLFLVQTVSRRDVEHLQAAGFRFAHLVNVVDIVGRSMQINNEDLTDKLTLMRKYASDTQMLEPGVHVACFAIRASVAGGFDIMTRRDARNQLPTMQMPLPRLTNRHIEFLQAMDGWKLSTCMKYLKMRGTNPTATQGDQTFATQLYDTFEALRDEIQDHFICDAQLVSRPVTAPCRNPGADPRPGLAQLISLRIMVPIHSKVPSIKLEFIPLAFFKVQQHVYPNSPDHAVFSRKVHREFAPILVQVKNHFRKSQGPSLPTMNAHPKRGSENTLGLNVTHNDHGVMNCSDRFRPYDSAMHMWDRISGRTGNSGGSSRHSKTPPSEIPREPNTSEASSDRELMEFGGIMVSQEVSVDVRDIGRLSPMGTRLHDRPVESVGQGTEMMALRRRGEDGVERLMRMGGTGIASKEVEDPPTYVDQLFAICAQNR